MCSKGVTILKGEIANSWISSPKVPFAHHWNQLILDYASKIGRLTAHWSLFLLCSYFHPPLLKNNSTGTEEVK